MGGAMNKLLFLILTISVLLRANYSQCASRSSNKKSVSVRNIRLRRGSEVGVVQRKVFRKNIRFEVSPAIMGTIVNDPFINSYLFGASIGFHLNDNIAVEGTYFIASSTDNDLNRGLQNDYGKTVSAGRTSNMYNGSLLLTPMYGKFSFFDKYIIHLDTFLALGYGFTKTDLASSPTYHIGIGQRFFINKWFAFRLDIRNYIHEEERSDGTNEILINKKNLLATFGVSMFFPSR
jgi:outer membrane beta-barrel protein